MEVDLILNENYFNKAQNEFNTFVKSNFDFNNDKIARKFKHTYCTVKIAEKICNNLGLNSEDTELAKIIALLHDIGRFPQAKNFKSFRDDRNDILDHATIGVNLLFENNYIRKFIENDKFDNIIKVAIENHNKYEINKDNLTERELLHCKIIRDADKTDIFRIISIENPYSLDEITKEEIENSLISDKIYNNIINKKLINHSDRKTAIDIWISHLAFIFDFNFSTGLNDIKEKDYINILLDRFTYNSLETKEKIETIRKICINYINEKLR